MVKRILSVTAKTFAVFTAVGAVLALLGLTASSRQGGMPAWSPLLSAAVSAIVAVGLWRLGSWLSPPSAIPASPAERRLIYQTNMKQAAVWCALLLAVFAGTFVFIAAAPSGGQSLVPILPYVLMAATIAFCRFCWYFVKTRGRSNSSASARATSDTF